MRPRRLASLLRSRRCAWLASPALAILWLALSGASNVAIGQCDVSPTSLDYGYVCLESVYLDKDFTITNTGEEPLSVNVTSPAPSYFALVAGGGPYTLDPAEERTVTVRFQPWQDWPGMQYTETIETGNDLCGDVLVTGWGNYRCHVLTQDAPSMTLDFGERWVGKSRVKWVVIWNYCDESLTGNVSESSEHYELDSGEGPFTLERDEYLDVWVRFRPQSAGTHWCSFETGNPLCADVWCVGTGIEVPETPTASRGGVIAMTLMLLTAGWILIRRRHRTSH